MILSVVVPVYNVEKFLKPCIESILCQSFTDYELILVNDGSKDRSGEICNYYSKKDNRIKVIHKNNGGLSSARNAGIDIASGEYIAFIDSDDYIRNDMFEILTKLAIENKADIVQCEYKKVYDNIKKYFKNNINDEVKLVNNLEVLSWLYNNQRTVSTIVAWSKIYRKDLFSEIRYPNGKIHEDEFTTYKLLYKSKKIVYTNQELYFYRQRNNSIMGAKYNKNRLALLEALNERLLFFKDKIYFKEIYVMTVKQYCNYLLTDYYLYKEANCDDKTTLNEIRKQGKSVYYEVLKYDKMAVKFKLTLFLISPVLLEKIRNIKRL